MSLVSFIGPRPNLLDINAVNPPIRLEVAQPILDFKDIARLKSISSRTNGKFRSCEVDITYPASWGKGRWKRVLPTCAHKRSKPYVQAATF